MELNDRWIFLSKNGVDEYVNMFAAGCGQPVIDTNNFDYTQSRDPIVLRGIMKYKIMQQCWQDSRTFYYIDSGYFGNQKYAQNPNGWKLYHRIVKNNLQHSGLVDRPADRWQQLGINIKPWKRRGSEILIIVPDEKPCKVYGTDSMSWLDQTVSIIKQHTDRTIVLRTRDPHRRNRKTFSEALVNTYAVVAFNSNAATEAVINGVPAFVTAPCHAAQPVASTDLTKIETPYYPDQDLVFKWACHLSYGQFHIKELKSGVAQQMLLQD